MKRTARFNDLKKPLVSIVLHNKNNEIYLRQCLDGILNQTYDNIEISFYDFASTDKSWDIAVEYQADNPGIITLLHMRKDYMLDGLVDHLQNVRGKYFMRFHSNCELRPELVEKCVNVFENHHNVAYVKIRKIISDSSANEILEPSIYDKSCIVPGMEHIENHLSTNPAPNSSISMFNTDIVKFNNTKLSGRYYNDSYSDETELCMKYNMAYINEPLFVYMKTVRESLTGESNYLTDLLNLYSAKINYIKYLYNVDEMQKIVGILPKIKKQISELCFVNSINALLIDDEINAKRLFHLSAVVDLSCERTEGFLKLTEYWKADKDGRNKLLDELKVIKNQFEKKQSFSLPKGSIVLDKDK